MPTELQISTRTVGDITIFDMTGRLVLEEGVLPFRQKIEELVKQGHLKFLLNLKDVTYIDSAGVGMMVAKYLSVRRKGGDVKLLHLTRRTQRVMSITKLMKVFDVFDEEADALRSFSATAPA